MRVLGFVGSLRRDSWNRRLWRVVRSVLEGEGAEVEEADIGSLPLYNGDLEAQGFPAPVDALRRQVAAADALVFVSPEYNNSVPGVLKNAVDWASRPPNPFAGKVAWVMGASTGAFGAVRMHMHLCYCLEALDVVGVPQPRVLVPQVPKAFGEDGSLQAEWVREGIERGVRRLLETARRLRGG